MSSTPAFACGAHGKPAASVPRGVSLLFEHPPQQRLKQQQQQVGDRDGPPPAILRVFETPAAVRQPSSLSSSSLFDHWTVVVDDAEDGGGVAATPSVRRFHSAYRSLFLLVHVHADGSSFSRLVQSSSLLLRSSHRLSKGDSLCGRTTFPSIDLPRMQCVSVYLSIYLLGSIDLFLLFIWLLLSSLSPCPLPSLSSRPPSKFTTHSNGSRGTCMMRDEGKTRVRICITF